MLLQPVCPTAEATLTLTCVNVHAQTLGSCPTVLQAAQDSLMASYSIPPAITAKLANFTAVSTYACYSPNSFYDRAWRAPNKLNLAVRLPLPPRTLHAPHAAPPPPHWSSSPC
jgi:hypothetical protein